ncbi:xanthine dehydrogenase family protein molybdopterin-binding subunit [Sphingomonas sp. So64.6b]|uniref:xanthine dehydrogenase family protein molybdopterin-binding subunit n=1 Tax=Sphingomonas sp. So64.6b TaxID=2997354 RepID=UPI001600E965|nr:xanthine dehydrogenase family protein molybdopterin-binding subunit [Sphingomonas sp. So64.6b]QNA82778.1 xanthine dehydrogenase family protein molybdopterin-binding subunit [Sphingomonas sp. So64.6b]
MTAFKMDADHAGLAMDRGVQGVLGKGIDRVEGVLKVMGAATYGYEHQLENVAYGYLITAPVAKGKVIGFDIAAARAMPGVLEIIIDDQRVARQAASFVTAANGNEAVDHFDQVLGAAIATSFEAARAAARAVRVEIAAEDGRFDTMADIAKASGPPKESRLQDVAKGDIDAAMAVADVTVDQLYSTPNQVHAAMEPHASIATWEDGKLTLYSSLQILNVAKPVLAKAVGIAPANVRIISPYIGGGFGGKMLGPEAVMAAIASQRLGRPVKIAMARAQLFHNVYRRTDTHQRIRLAAGADGRLTAIGHDNVVSQGPDGGFMEPVALGTIALYAAATRHFSHKVVTLDMVQAGAVRAPGEAVGMLALETAIDEMAEQLGRDPIDFRKLNEPEVDPTTGAPFSTRRLVECLDEGAKRFGWTQREATPGSVRDGEWLVGMGVAAAVRINLLIDSEARVTLGVDGRATVETDMTDIGTGTYTILSQIAGESLGLPVHCVDVKLGDTDLPPGSGSGGSFGAASAGSSVALACEDIVAELANRMKARPEDMTLKDGHAIAGNRRVSLDQLVGDAPIVATGKISQGSNARTFSQAAHGAQFAEVGVNAVTGEVRVRRMLGVFEAGRILNAKTARSQAIGGMIWGIGYALMEDAVLDKRYGQFVNHDLGEYHVPVHADVPHLDVHFIEDIDHHANPIGVKGLGELTISGAGAAVTNAIYNACGVRVREFPMTLDKILAGLPPV